jgi:protein-L-isoaspartate(D-aspartate) O-methyltransferase
MEEILAVDRRSRCGRGRCCAGLPLALLALACSAAEDEARPAPAPVPAGVDGGFATARRQMVEWIRSAHGFEDQAVLDALARVPRHRFVPDEQLRSAYEDRPLPIGFGQTISQPYIVAAMTAAAQLRGGERVLEVGTGSGYQAAVLAEIAGEVWSVEILRPLGERAAALLAELGYRNVQVRIGDGYAGWPEQAPFDAILVTAAPDHVPGPLLEQLAPGGRLVMPVGDERQELVRITRGDDGFATERLMGVRFVPMTGEARRRD